MGNTEWRIVRGFDNYLVSNDGRVMNSKTGRGLKPRIKKTGYHQVALYNDTYREDLGIHVLVARAFIHNPFPDKYDEVNHIDEIKAHNYQANLEWCDSQLNNEHTFAKTYILRSPKGERVEIHNLRKFCRENGLNQGNMVKLFSGKAKTCKGWKAIEKKRRMLSDHLM